MHRFFWLITIFLLVGCSDFDPTCCLARSMEPVTTDERRGKVQSE